MHSAVRYHIKCRDPMGVRHISGYFILCTNTAFNSPAFARVWLSSVISLFGKVVIRTKFALANCGWELQRNGQNLQILHWTMNPRSAANFLKKYLSPLMILSMEKTMVAKVINELSPFLDLRFLQNPRCAFHVHLVRVCIVFILLLRIKKNHVSVTFVNSEQTSI